MKDTLHQNYDIDSLEIELHKNPEAEFMQEGSKRVFNLFHEMSQSVPAYKDFLKTKKFSPSRVKSPEYIKMIPVIDKDNYLRKYPTNMLCWDGSFPKGRWVISTTSGSTGKPFYFPRQVEQDLQYSITAELYLRNNFQIQNKKTLYIVAFPMGAWIGGLFTYDAVKQLAERGGYDLSIITPGIHKQEVINAVKQLGHFYDQIIIGVYAPFLKDIIDDGSRAGINWEKYNLGFVFSAEAFTENLREYVINKTGIKDELLGTLNHYGTVDLGTMAHETPESILIRRVVNSRSKPEIIFPEARRLPTLCQYNPKDFYFEEESNNLLCSAYSGIPLVRYDLKDYGGVIGRGEMHAKLIGAGVKIENLIKKNHLLDKTWNLPFVYVYERNDFSVSYYAAQVYPDTIRRAVETCKQSDLFTGKFTMEVDYDTGGRQQLWINLEAKPKVQISDSLVDEMQRIMHAALLKDSSEYLNTWRTIGDSFGAMVRVWPYEEPNYFKPGVKQKWVIK